MKLWVWRLVWMLCMGPAMLNLAQAATFRAMDLSELVKQSSAVVQCRVVDMESSYKPTPQGDKIYTRYLLQVDEQWLSKTSTDDARHLSLWVQGGQVGNTVQRVLGYPRLQLNQDYVLFIERLASGLPLTGGAQGVYRVLQSKATTGAELEALTGTQGRLGISELKAQVQALEVLQ